MDHGGGGLVWVTKGCSVGSSRCLRNEPRTARFWRSRPALLRVTPLNSQFHTRSQRQDQRGSGPWQWPLRIRWLDNDKKIHSFQAQIESYSGLYISSPNRELAIFDIERHWCVSLSVFISTLSAILLNQNKQGTRMTLGYMINFSGCNFEQSFLKKHSKFYKNIKKNIQSHDGRIHWKLNLLWYCVCVDYR